MAVMAHELVTSEDYEKCLDSKQSPVVTEGL